MCWKYSHSEIHDCYCVPNSTLRPVQRVISNMKEEELELLLSPGMFVEYRYYVHPLRGIRLKKFLYCNRCLHADDWVNRSLDIKPSGITHS